MAGCCISLMKGGAMEYWFILTAESLQKGADYTLDKLLSPRVCCKQGNIKTAELISTKLKMLFMLCHILVQIHLILSHS